jgi:hypothetical protein
VSSDGVVRYVGERYVGVSGPASRTIDPKLARRVACELERRGFFALPEEYHRCATDLPSMVIEATINGRTRRVSRNVANEMCRGRGQIVAPVWLVAMEDWIDQVAGSARWVEAAAEEPGPGPIRISPE